jgi:hypothetical protein
MSNIPSNVSYGTVKGRFIVAYSDSVDSGLEPDALPAAGSVFFTASPILLKNQTASPDPVTILPATVEVVLDEDGYLRSFEGEAGLGVRLVATDDPDNNPVDWTWRVDFRLTDQAGTPVSLPSFSFSLPSNATVDLTDLSPVPSANGTFYLVGPKGDQGPANELAVGTVTTGAASTEAQVTITGESPSQTINFTIPQGVQGIQGIQGIQGEKGDALNIKGTVATEENLPLTGNQSNDGYIVETNGHLWIWQGAEEEWLDVGEIKGPGVAEGGDTHAILVKASNASYDTTWTNIIDGGTA